MRTLTVISPEPAYYRVIHDQLRIYFPRLRYEEAEDRGFFYLLEDSALEDSAADRLNGNATGAGNGEGQYLVKIEKKLSPLELKVIFLQAEVQLAVQSERVRLDTFSEENMHQERRLLRLAFHRALVRAFSLNPSPWGVLTGVRPTKIAHRFLDEGYPAQHIIEFLTRDFDVSRERAELLTKVAVFQHPLLENGDERLLSLYVGIPFCPTRCHYCSFPAFSLEKWGRLLPDYLAALEREIAEIGDALRDTGVKVSTVYLGGGTPTVLSEGQLHSILEIIEKHFSFTAGRELTVEGGRPDTLTKEKLRVLKEHQVTRLSINPQTMQEETLVRIGRQHTVQEVYQAYALAREAGIPILNMDLIVGLPGENCAVLAETLAQVRQLAPENITLHALAMKRAAYYRQEKISLAVPSEGLTMMNLAHQHLQAAGYFPYYLYRQKEIFAHGENVGYTVTGKECLYNIQMMEERQTILGFGVGSGSKFVHKDDWTLENYYNPKDVQVYLDRLGEIIRRKVDNVRRIL